MAGTDNTTEYYVYLHRRADDGRVFYVGKGKGKRARSKKRNRKWHNIVNKHGFTWEILFDGLTEREALDEEVSVIAELRYFGYSLANLTDGGEGTSGIFVSEETKAKLRAANLGKKLTPETIAKVIASHIGKKRTPEQRARMGLWCKGVPLSDEHKEKLRKAKLGKKLTTEHKRKVGDASRGKPQRPEWIEKRSAAVRKMVLCVDTGQVFHGIKNAVAWLNSIGVTANNIKQISACASGKIMRAHGYVWKYV